MVILKSAEIYPYAGVGSRIFDVMIEGKELISNLDLLSKVARYRAYDVPISVTVSDGALDIHFRADKGSAKINAILVQKE